MTDRWALADLRATAIMDATRNARVAARNGRTLAEAAGLATRGSVDPSNDASTVPSKRGSTEAPGDGFLCLEFTVPCQPRGWQRDTPLGYGRSVKTAAEAAYQRDIAKFARHAKHAAGVADLLRGGVRLSVIAYLAVPKSHTKRERAERLAGQVLPTCKPDADNVLKSVMDALSGILWVDDKQVVAGSCLKMWAETGSLYVRVQAL